MPIQDHASLTLVLPVYNGATSLRRSLDAAAAYLASCERVTELLVVDDHSTDATPQILQEFGASRPAATWPVFTVLRNDVNRGKGFSVRRGAMAASGERIVFTDADLTYPLENVTTLLALLDAGADLAYGDRMHPGSRYVVAPTFFGRLFSRHLSGRLFNAIVRAVLLPGILDTQAGLKGFRRQAIRQVAPLIRLDRFSFDVELLFVARRLGLQLDSSPVRFIYRKEPSTVRFCRDSLAMLIDLTRVRWRGLRRVYELQAAARSAVESDPRSPAESSHAAAPAGLFDAVAPPPGNRTAASRRRSLGG